MECTQRLDFTQELLGTQSARVCLEQIAFLGICGEKYPLKKGPNKIGRDPATCNITLDCASISRQHAVINIMNNNMYMLMDLDSLNKTKLLGRTLQPYISEPLQNGDTIQFGDLFGIFRLLNEQVDLPMTQAIEIPDTPVPMKSVSRINAIRTVPESPDVSDKDDSIIVPSQPKNPELANHKNRNFIKPGKTISIQPVGTNKIDNIYWNSSKKSTSLNLDGSNVSLNDSKPLGKSKEQENKISNDIHELETQMFPGPKLEEETDSIYGANTQLPKFDNPALIHTENTQMPGATNSPSIHSLNTQLPCGRSPSIHHMNTQLPDSIGSPSVYGLETQMPGDNLPEVCKINEQHDMQFNLCADERDCSIYNAETQLYPTGKENIPVNPRNNDSPASIKSNKLNTSNDDVLFDDVDQPFEGFESQAILTEDVMFPMNISEPDIEPLSQIVKPKCTNRNMRIKSDEEIPENLSQIIKPKSAKRNMRIKSKDSTDSEDEDIILTQNVFKKKVADDDTTDCEEDDLIELNTVTTNKVVSIAQNIEDMPTQVIVDKESSVANNDEDFEDLPTQVLDVNVIEKDVITEKDNINADLDFEDLPTQVLEEDVPNKLQPLYIKQLTKQEENSPFKIPFNSALKAKKKEGSRTPKIKPIKYYQDTQDIYDDLCTQRIDSVEIKLVSRVKIDKEKLSNKLVLDTSVVDVDTEEKAEDFVRNLTNQEMLDMIGLTGLDSQLAQVKKVPSDGSNASDVENTPKKQRPFKLMDIDLPDSQEIKTSVSLSTRAAITESSSESETENNSEDQCTPVVFRKKRNPKPDVKLDLTKKFDLGALPTRVITRVRKPTARLKDGQNKKNMTEILKPTFMTETESEMDKDIITENISRLKNKNEKAKNNHSIKESSEVVELNTAETDKKMRSCRKKDIILKSEEKLEKPKDSFNELKSKGRKKRDPKNIKKVTDSKNQSSITDESTNKFSVVEPKDITHVNNSKVETRESTHSLAETKRSTRGRNAKAAKYKEKSPEKESQTEKHKRKYTRKATKSEPKNEEKREPSPEKEIRRSKRQRPIKEEVKKETPKSILKKSVTVLSEESAVYNLSSSSNSESCSKRPFLDDSEAPSAKRKRSVATNINTSKATTARPTKTQYVLFTAFPFDGVKIKLESMGAVVVTDVMQSTVLLTKQIKRTFKLLCAVGLGKPIVGPDWVQACADNKTIVDPWQYLIKDEIAEKRFCFSLVRTLKGKRNFLKGYNVSSTPSVLPNAHEMKLIVECSGGAWRAGGPAWVCVSTAADAALWPELRRRGAALVSSEFILGGVLRQRLDIQPNTLN